MVSSEESGHRIHKGEDQEEAGKGEPRNSTEDLSAYTDINYLQPGEAVFYTEAGILHLRLHDREYRKVDLYSSFPLSLKKRFISVRSDRDEEIGVIEDLDAFPENSRRALLRELQWRYFAPAIESISSIKEEFGYLYWEVETDRGFRKFVTRGQQDSLRFVTDNRLLIIDMTGNRFEIPDLEGVDPASRRELEWIIE